MIQQHVCSISKGDDSMKIKLTARGYNSNSGTIATQMFETSVTPQTLGYVTGKLIYTIESSGFRIDTHEVYLAFMKSISRLDLGILSDRYFPVFSNKKFGDNIKITISLAKNI